MKFWESDDKAKPASATQPAEKVKVAEPFVATNLSGEAVPQLVGAKVSDIEPGMPMYGSIEGAIIVAIENGSAAAQVGLQPGDIIYGVNRRRVHGVKDLLAALRAGNPPWAQVPAQMRNVDPDLLAHGRQKIQPILGRTTRFGGDQPGARHTAVAHLGAADTQRIDRAQDRGLAQPAGAGDALAQADDARERVDHAEAVPRRACDQEPAVVGAEIERGIGRTGHVQSVRGVMTRIVTRMPVWRPPAPPLPVRARNSRVEAGRPGLVVHQKPFPATEAEVRPTLGSTARR